jgi:hypothetical protein
MATRFQNESIGENSDKTCVKQDLRQARRGSARTRWERLLLLATAVCAVAAPSTGCTMARGLGRGLTQHEFLDDFMVGYRNSAWSARAWLCRRDRYLNHEFLSDFEAGFRQGYQDVANGSNGCVPAVCPRAYWGWQYQSSDGQRRMNAWFEAYPLGVQAAEEDGIGHWSHVATVPGAAAPCATCPTGATYAVPPKHDAHGKPIEPLPLDPHGVPEPLPYPLLETLPSPSVEIITPAESPFPPSSAGY